MDSAAISRIPAAGISTRILIVDQDRRVGVILSFMLSARNFDEVRAVRSVGRAMAIAEQFRPEIVFLDLELPDDGSMTVACTLARDTRRPRPRLFAMASGAEARMRDKLRAAGFERCLEKPVSDEDLDKVLGIRVTA